MTEPAATLAGGCLCGGVRYRITGPLGAPEHCHCGMCRKAHGAAFSTNAVLAAADFTLTEGQALLASYDSSPNRRKHFCGRCGSPLFIRRLDRPEIVVLALGSLEGDPGVRPQRHVFVDSKAPWLDLDAVLPRYRVYPGCEPEPEAG